VLVAKYFVFIGSALAALLLIINWYYAPPSAAFADRSRITATAVIRIKSERKWPEKIEFDTSQPTIVPPDDAVSPVTGQPPRSLPEQTTGKPRLDALAQLRPDTPLSPARHRAVQIKRRLARSGRPNRMGELPVRNRLPGLDPGEACCRSGWTNNWPASPNAVPRKHATPSWSTGWLALSQK